jgi:hypothetical protein
MASIFRMIFTLPLIRDGDKADLSYNVVWMGAWTISEMALGLVVACILSVTRLFQRAR